MALTDLWNSDRIQITDKRVDQLIAFAGEGRLRDGNDTSQELRDLMMVIPSDLIAAWITQCLENRFTDFGFVVQDIVNEIGRRLNFEVTHGVYRGHSNEGYDGLWQIPSGGAILVESKSSTAYSINLTRIADYRKQVAPNLELTPEDISILLVIGSEDTDELEAQVRGSRFAWDIRLLGVHSLFRLLQLKESLDDPQVEQQIRDILVPQEFTRLDGIVDLVFATAEDAQAISEEEAEESTDEPSSAKPRASFYAEIITNLERHLGKSLVKRSRVQWGSPDASVLLSCQVSKEYQRGNADFWFGLKRTTKESLEAHTDPMCVFGLGSPDRVVVLPFSFLAPHLDGFFTSPDNDGGILHWHVRFVRDNDRIQLMANRDQDRIDVTEHVLED